MISGHLIKIHNNLSSPHSPLKAGYAVHDKDISIL